MADEHLWSWIYLETENFKGNIRVPKADLDQWHLDNFNSNRQGSFPPFGSNDPPPSGPSAPSGSNVPPGSVPAAVVQQHLEQARAIQAMTTTPSAPPSGSEPPAGVHQDPVHPPYADYGNTPALLAMRKDRTGWNEASFR